MQGVKLLELYKDWEPERLKQRCHSFRRALGDRDEIIKRIWVICHTASKDHPKGARAYDHFQSDFDQIRKLCHPIVEPYLDDDAPPVTNGDDQPTDTGSVT